ncbi:MAG TPA: S-methyl-5-thioribose-1-phosphate isomerase [Candidatus Binatia bacterium]|nr:S-methyl-5-thioribose-1-phosphate isomerase [Candidatus Binatia bacterium]
MRVHTVEWKSGRVVMIDQRLLPNREVYRLYRDAGEVMRAIREMVVRGAPAIGVAAAMGIALGARSLSADRFAREFEKLCRAFAATRPTAVNLFWAIERMRRVARENAHRPLETIVNLLEREAQSIYEEDLAANRRLGEYGAELLPKKCTVLTHCNAGGLATAGIGTALGVICAARDAGKKVSVYADETRPVLQGARLTAWELKRERIPVTVVTDGMAAALMRQGKIDAVVVGTDRTAANGDVANKIGTYSLAVAAAHHGVPFYVAAPISSIDLACKTGDQIPIEERAPTEVTHINGRSIVPTGVKVWNPAFDVTPHALVTAIITENGVARAPYGRSLQRVVRGEPVRSPARVAASSGRRRRRQ